MGICPIRLKYSSYIHQEFQEGYFKVTWRETFLLADIKINNAEKE